MSSGSNMLICRNLFYVLKNNVLHRYVLNIHEDRIDKCSSSSPSSRVVASRVAIILYNVGTIIIMYTKRVLRKCPRALAYLYTVIMLLYF